ncbi:MAG: hypothetical protein ACRCW2_16130 [Cellulosilyticaceae bacterium]
MFSHTSKLSKEKCLKKITDGAQDPTSNTHTAILGETTGEDSFSLELSKTTLSTDIVRKFHGTVTTTTDGTLIEGSFKHASKTYLTWGILIIISLFSVILSTVNPNFITGFYLPPSICRVILVFLIFMVCLYSYTGRHQEQKLIAFLTEL